MSKESELKARKFWFDWMPRHLYRVSMDEHSEVRVAEFAEMLRVRPDLSYVLYINHISYPDPAFAANLLQRVDPEQTRKIIVPASFSNINKRELKNIFSTFMTNVAGRCGMDVIPIIQAHQLKDQKKYKFTAKQARVTYKNLVSKLSEIEDEEIPVGCIISPEGHRSEVNKLGEVWSGIQHIGRASAPLVYVPLGIWYQGRYNRNLPNFFKRVDLSIGEMTVQETKYDGPTMDELMYKLAAVIPLKMRGMWGW